MNRTATRVTATVFAAAVTFGLLKWIAVLAAVDSPAARLVVVRPAVEVRPSAPPSALAAVATAEPEGEP